MVESDVGQEGERIPPLVLLHGFPLNARMWEDALVYLPERLCVYAPDLPGFGMAPALPNQDQHNASMDDYVEAIREMVEAASIPEPFVLAGLSMGGYMALEFASQYPDKLCRLILCDTKTEADAPAARQVRLQMAEKLIRVAAMPASCDPVADPRKAIAETMLPKLLSPRTVERHREIVDKVASMVLRTEMLAIASAQRAMAHRRDTQEVVRKAEIPIDCIVGEDDTLTTPEMMQRIVDDAKRGRLFVIPEAGHLPPMEQPERFAEALWECIVGTDATSS